MNSLRLLLAGLSRLGARRLVGLVSVFLISVAVLLVSSLYLNRPSRETLYAGLDSEDVNLIGAALSEFNIPFDVDASGKTVLVDYGQTSRARMLLAQRGLPRSDKSGYELFDQMGSLGLTSFMQQVTRVRALEGELIRTIQELDGIKSARVHLAIKADNAFRSKDDQTTASVVIRTEGQTEENVAISIRQIVAAAIPGLKPEQVSVMTTDGTVLKASGAGMGGTSERLFDLEMRVARDIEQRLERTVAPLVGANNLRVSVTARLNMDKRQVTETKFDPDSKVERSTRTVKESGQNQNGSAANAVTVEQNIPQEVQQSTDSGGAQSKSEKKDETVNYEVNSSQTATVSDDYSIERISVALVLNRQALAGAAEATAASPALDEKLASISNVVKSAVGFVEKRGDVVDVSAFDFVDNGTALEPLPGPGFGEIISGNLGTLINALAFLIGTLIVILLGLRPSMKLIVGQGQPEQLSSPDPMSALPMQNAQVDFASNFAADTPAAPEDPSRSKLNKAVELDLDRAAQVLKQWLDQPGNEAA